MKFATVRDLKNRTSELLRKAAGGTDVLVTSHGRPVAILQGMREEDLEDYVLANHPTVRASIEEARADLERHGGIPLDKVIARLEEKARRRRRGRRGRRLRR